MEDGYCEHGTYVGGCGIDWMCGYCEDGWTWAEYQSMLMFQRIALRTRHEVLKMTALIIGQSVGWTPEEIRDYIKIQHY